MFRHRPLAGANLAMVANAGGFVAMTFLATLYMQQVLGFDALEAGLGFVPLAASAGAGGLLAPAIVARAGPRRTAAASLAVTALTSGFALAFLVAAGLVALGALGAARTLKIET